MNRAILLIKMLCSVCLHLLTMGSQKSDKFIETAGRQKKTVDNICFEKSGNKFLTSLEAKLLIFYNWLIIRIFYDPNHESPKNNLLICKAIHFMNLHFSTFVLNFINNGSKS